MATLAADRLDQLLAPAYLIRIAFAKTGRQRMRLRPLITFLFGKRPKESRDRHSVLLPEIEIGHPRARTKFMRIFNPAHHPARIDLGTDLFQARSNLGNIFIAFNQVTSRTADLLEHYLSLRQK